MEFRVTIKTKHVLVILIFITTASAIGLVVGYGTFTPSTFGHSWGEVDCDTNLCVNLTTNRVGIGTTNPAVKLDVIQNSAIKVGQAYLSSGGDYVHIANNEWYNGASWQTTAAGALIQLSGQNINFYRHDAAGGHTFSAVIDGSGNVGIGASPAQKLQITGGGAYNLGVVCGNSQCLHFNNNGWIYTGDTSGNVYGGVGLAAESLWANNQICLRGDCRTAWPADGKNYQVFRSPGTYTFTVPSGITKILVEAWGGGGGGGGTSDGAGGGGGGGSYASDIFSVTSGSQYTVTVGNGGAGGGAGGSGAAAGASSFGSLVYAGGGTGGAGATGGSFGSGGQSTGASPATLNIVGEDGEEGWITSFRRGGHGGSSPKGGFGGMPCPLTGGGGCAAYGSPPGGGGSGSASWPSYGSGGGNGAEGRVIVWW